MQKKHLTSIVCAVLALSLMLVGCGGQNPPETTKATEPMTEVSSEPTPETTQPPTPETTEPSEATEPPTETEKQTEAVIYIGSKHQGYTTVNVVLNGELTPEALINAISEETNWVLTLASPVSIGKGGMTVDLSSAGALVNGPGYPQKDEYSVFDSTSLAIVIMDSIQETLKQNFVTEDGNPDQLDVYFCLDGGDMDLPNADIFFPCTEVWDSDNCMGN